MGPEEAPTGRGLRSGGSRCGAHSLQIADVRRAQDGRQGLVRPCAAGRRTDDLRRRDDRGIGGRGFKIVIYANQMVRASIRAMRDTLAVIKKDTRPGSVNDQIVKLKEVYDIVGVPQMEQDERKFLPVGGEKITAIIAAAGFEKQLLPLIEDKPKCLLDIKGKTILERQVSALNECNIKEIALVRGYKKEAITLPNIRYYDNDRYEETGELYSLFCAENEMKSRTILLYGDIIFETAVLEKLLKSPADITLVVDLAWSDLPQQGQDFQLKPDLSDLGPSPGQELSGPIHHAGRGHSRDDNRPAYPARAGARRIRRHGHVLRPRDCGLHRVLSRLVGSLSDYRLS